MDAFFVSRSMADLIINGGRPLSGTIVPSGNKNSALPVFCATLLASGPVRLLNVPDITDLEKLVEFFVAQGSRITWTGRKGKCGSTTQGLTRISLKRRCPLACVRQCCCSRRCSGG